MVSNFLPSQLYDSSSRDQDCTAKEPFENETLTLENWIWSTLIYPIIIAKAQDIETFQQIVRDSVIFQVLFVW